MRITINCEQCGRRHELESTSFPQGAIYLVCHDCEVPLRAELRAPDATQELTSRGATGPRGAFEASWGDTIDLGIPATETS